MAQQPTLKRVKVVRPDSILIDTERLHCWAIVQMVGKDDTNPPGSYYLIPIFPRKINDLIKMVIEGKDILIDVTVALPHVVLHSGTKPNPKVISAQTFQAELDKAEADLNRVERSAIEHQVKGQLYQNEDPTATYEYKGVEYTVARPTTPAISFDHDNQRNMFKIYLERVLAIRGKMRRFSNPDVDLAAAKWEVFSLSYELNDMEDELKYMKKPAVTVGTRSDRASTYDERKYIETLNKVMTLKSELLSAQAELFKTENEQFDNVPDEPTLIRYNPFSEYQTKELVEHLTEVVMTDTPEVPRVNHKPQGFVVTLEDPVANINQPGNIFAHDTSTTAITVLDRLGDSKLIATEDGLSMAPRGYKTPDGGFEHDGVVYSIDKNGYITMDGIQQIKQLAPISKGIVDENSLSQFLPETVVTWPAAVKWFPALDFIIMVGWKLANFTQIITSLLTRLEESEEQRG
jgi:hypothetical protein